MAELENLIKQMIDNGESEQAIDLVIQAYKKKHGDDDVEIKESEYIMNYEDAMDYEVTREEARKEIALHCLKFSDFVAEVGLKKTYKGSEVLNWLGY